MTRIQRSRSIFAALIAVVVGLGWPVSSAANDDGDSGSFTGLLRIGYRIVDVGGAEDKYREDLDLEDGARLFAFRFDFAPKDSPVADLVVLDVSNLGGDPFETIHFEARKFGRMSFGYDRAKSTYFYHDTILPVAQATPALSDAGDFHTFDFDRVRERANFGYRFNARAKLDVGFERFTKRGESTTTLDIQRDEFELDQPIDESWDNLRVGFEYAWKRATLVLEEQVREYRNAVHVFLPGFSLGENPGDASTLDFFFFDRPYTFDSLQHTVRLNCRPNARTIVRASAVVQTLELDVTGDEESQGTDFRGNPFTTDTAGRGAIDRDAELFDLDVSYLISDRLALVASASRQHLDQSGQILFDDQLDRGVWDIATTGGELGVEASVAPDVTIAGGLLFESREVEHGIAEGAGEAIDLERRTSDHDGFFARVDWRPTDGASFQASYESSSFDDPFALASPSDRERISVRASIERSNGFYGQATYALHRLENKISGWDSDLDQITVRLGYRRDGLDLALGYSALDAERQVDRLVTTLPGFGGGVTFLFPVLYQAESDFLDGRVRWQASERLSLGAEARRYDNDGSFALQRDDLRAWLELEVTDAYLVGLAYRTVDYDEDAFDFDDYDADILELSVGYRW